MDSGDWSEWRNHVLRELERQNNNLEALAERFESYEKTCLQKEGEQREKLAINEGKQRVINAEIRMKIYFIDALVGAAAAIAVILIQWAFTYF